MRHAVFLLVHPAAQLSLQLLGLRHCPSFDTFVVMNGVGSYEAGSIFVSDQQVFSRCNEKSLEKRIIPGNADLVLLEAFRAQPNYESYLLIEYDVFYSGDIRRLVSHVLRQYRNCDFAAPFIRAQRGNEHWMWWSSLRTGGETIEDHDRYSSFLQFAFYSNAALCALQTAIEGGWSGHHEVLHATLFKVRRLKIAEFEQDTVLHFDVETFRATSPCVRKHNRYLHHPVKTATYYGSI
jgi:hypothetical protein